ncbi:hypothetical protein P2W68_23060 [Chryseobacterium arthrosphaerae]|nr:hypothetical protein [Chryseobacterium arthrosphaerae]WES97664.1 hypothetical protein P2W68_23060 [Chryseobacterium arthrosphaerae]
MNKIKIISRESLVEDLFSLQKEQDAAINAAQIKILSFAVKR